MHGISQNARESFILGLRREISLLMYSQDPVTFDDAVGMTVSIEKRLYEFDESDRFRKVADFKKSTPGQNRANVFSSEVDEHIYESGIRESNVRATTSRPAGSGENRQNREGGNNGDFRNDNYRKKRGNGQASRSQGGGNNDYQRYNNRKQWQKKDPTKLPCFL